MTIIEYFGGINSNKKNAGGGGTSASYTASKYAREEDGEILSKCRIYMSVFECDNTSHYKIRYITRIGT